MGNRSGSIRHRPGRVNLCRPAVVGRGRTTHFALDICVTCNVPLESTGGHNRRVARLTWSRVAKPQEACLLTSFDSIDVDLRVPLAWFLDTGQSQRRVPLSGLSGSANSDGFLSLLNLGQGKGSGLIVLGKRRKKIRKLGRIDRTTARFTVDNPSTQPTQTLTTSRIPKQ